MRKFATPELKPATAAMKSAKKFVEFRVLSVGDHKSGVKDLAPRDFILAVEIL
jgi:hypothetical protein